MDFAGWKSEGEMRPKTQYFLSKRCSLADRPAIGMPTRQQAHSLKKFKSKSVGQQFFF